MTFEGRIQRVGDWGEHPERKSAKAQPARAAGRAKRGLHIGTTPDVVSAPTIVADRLGQAAPEPAINAIKDILASHTDRQLTTTEIFGLLSERVEHARITLGKTGALLGGMVTSGDISREKIAVEGGKDKTTWAMVEKPEETKTPGALRTWFRARFGRQAPLRTVESHEVIAIAQEPPVREEKPAEPIVIADFAPAEKVSETLPASFIPTPRKPKEGERVKPIPAETETDAVDQPELQKPENLASGFSETRKSSQSFKIGPDRMPWLNEERDVNLVQVTIAGSGEKFNLGSVIKGNKDLLAAANRLDARGKAIINNLFYSHLPRFLTEVKSVKTIMHPVTNEPIHYFSNRAGQRVYFMRFNGQAEINGSNGDTGEQLPTILCVAVCDKPNQDLVLKQLAEQYHK